MNAHTGQPSYRHLSHFFIPLALMSMSQALTYPLVAMVASRGEGGALNMAGLAQSNTFMFFLGSIAAGAVTAGMAYGKGAEGFARFRRVNAIMMLVVGCLHAFFALPGPSHLVFGVIMGLKPAIEEPARLTFFACLPLHMLFFLRNPYHVALFNARQTARAYVATLGRIVLTAALSPLFCAVGLVGPLWAVVCLTLPLLVEIAVSWALARRLIARLEPDRETVASLGEILRFSLTLSVGTVFLSMSGYVMGAFVARAPEPERVLPAAYLALGLVTPVNFGASRVQALVVSFAGERNAVGRLWRFALMAGAVLGMLPLLFQIPGLRELYYVSLQKLPPGDLGIAATTAFGMVLAPLTVAFRSLCEGRAAFLRRPEIVLGGQGIYLGIMTSTAFIALQAGASGSLLIPIAVISGNVVSAGAMVLMLGRQWHDAPVPLVQPVLPGR